MLPLQILSRGSRTLRIFAAAALIVLVETRKVQHRMGVITVLVLRELIHFFREDVRHKRFSHFRPQ